MKAYIIFLIVPIALGLACSDRAMDDMPTKLFFDLEDYFNQEKARLHTQQAQKTVSINGVEEVQNINGGSFDDEFELFANSDINKIAWLDKYRVDSLYNYNGDLLSKITYTALDENLRTQLLEVIYDNNQVTRINIDNLMKSIIVDARQTLTYISGKQIKIKSGQKVLFGEDRAFEINIEFL